MGDNSLAVINFHGPRITCMDGWDAILCPFAARAIYDQTQSYALVFTGITILLLISTAMTALLIKPSARVGTRIA